jgi:hypothetical protein
MKIKKIDDLLKDQESFESLLGMVLLFDKNSEYYKFTGWVTAALLDYDDPDKGISIFAINTGRPSEWFTFKYTREDLRKMFENCIEFVGKTEEESFILEKYAN